MGREKKKKTSGLKETRKGREVNCDYIHVKGHHKTHSFAVDQCQSKKKKKGKSLEWACVAVI